MPSRRSVLVLLVSLLLMAGLETGCHSEPKHTPPPPPPPATLSDADRMQSNLQREDPGARVGLVLKVNTAENNAAVRLAEAGNNATPIKEGDVFTIQDSQEKTVANGSVVYVENGIYVVNYVPAAGGRAPEPGDLAIHVSVR